jgi:hypothetical protein
MTAAAGRVLKNSARTLRERSEPGAPAVRSEPASGGQRANEE